MSQFLVTKTAQILRIVGESNNPSGIIYHAKKVRSDIRLPQFNDVKDAEIEFIEEKDVSLIDTNYALLRREVDRVIGFVV